MASRLTSVLADPARLAAVRQTNLLDTPAEDAFDRVARMAARLLEVPIALVPLIEDDRQFFKACVGLPEPWASARQTPLSHSLCQHVLVARQPLAIGDTGRDALARDNPLVRELGLAAYLGVPLIDPSGHALGSMCVADHRPRDWTPEQVAILTDLGGLVMTQIQLRAELATRGELERRLIDVEASLQALLERLPGVVYAVSPDSPNSVLYMSPQIQTLIGLAADDCIGDPGLWERLVHPEDLEWVVAECERTNQTGEPFSGEYRMCTTAGQVRWVRDEAVLVRAGDGRPLPEQGAAVASTDQDRLVANPTDLAVGGAHAVLVREGFPGLVGLLALGCDPVQVVGMHQPVPQLGIADAVGRRHAHERLDLRAHVDDRIRCLGAERIHHTREAFQQRLQAGLDIDQASLELAPGRQLRPQLDLGHDQPSQVGQDGHLVRSPVPRAVVDHAHRAEDITGSVDQWDPEIGGQPKLPDQGVVAGKRITSGVADRQRLASDHHVLT